MTLPFDEQNAIPGVSTFYEDLPNMEKSMFVAFAPGLRLNAVNAVTDVVSHMAKTLARICLVMAAEVTMACITACAIRGGYHSGVNSRQFLFGGMIVQCFTTHGDISAHNDGARAPKQHCNHKHQTRIHE